MTIQIKDTMRILEFAGKEVSIPNLLRLHFLMPLEIVSYEIEFDHDNGVFALFIKPGPFFKFNSLIKMKKIFIEFIPAMYRVDITVNKWSKT